MPIPPCIVLEMDVLKRQTPLYPFSFSNGAQPAWLLLFNIMPESSRHIMQSEALDTVVIHLKIISGVADTDAATQAIRHKVFILIKHRLRPFD